MKLPFTSEQFFEVFKDYNLFIWPIQIIFYLLAVIVIFFAFNNKNIGSKIILFILFFFWIWMGIMYHLAFFSVINKAAYIFGILFIMQGILFFYTGIFNHYFLFKYKNNLYGITGAAFILFALIIYPVLNIASGHEFPASPTFGLPCPTTIFTFGVLLLNEKKTPFFVLIVPLNWSVVGFSAAFTLGVYEDISLIITGIITTIMVFTKNKEMAMPSGQSVI